MGAEEVAERHRQQGDAGGQDEQDDDGQEVRRQPILAQGCGRAAMSRIGLKSAFILAQAMRRSKTAPFSVAVQEVRGNGDLMRGRRRGTIGIVFP